MSKTIDVMPGDEWGFLESGAVVQYRNGRWRLVERERRNVGVWCGEPGDKHRRDPGEIELPEVAVLAILHAWGYTLTRSDDAKPADHVPDAGKKVEAADAPKVSELWGRIHIGSGKIRMYASRELAIKAQSACKDPDWVVMKDPVIRIRSVDEEARANINSIAGAVVDAQDRLSALESRLAAVEKPTPTGVVKVPAPVSHQGLFTDGELRVIDARDSAWRVALTAAGVKWEESK